MYISWYWKLFAYRWMHFILERIYWNYDSTKTFCQIATAYIDRRTVRLSLSLIQWFDDVFFRLGDTNLQLQVLLIHLNEYLIVFKVNPRHGYWDEDTVSGRCILRCDGGYEPSGCHVIRYSHRHGKWNHDVPSCQKGKNISI